MSGREPKIMRLTILIEMSDGVVHRVLKDDVQVRDVNYKINYHIVKSGYGHGFESLGTFDLSLTANGVIKEKEHRNDVYQDG